MSGEDEPYDELADIDAGTDRDPFEVLAEEEGFSEQGSDIDEDAVWDQLTEDTDRVPPEAVGDAVVPKSRFCQQCEYFSAPPEVGCGHTGTEIAELVDADRFRVVDCPVVARRREIGEFE
ncbi:MAG: hypothetical protein ABEJ06_06640 [Haloarculaceae archaeon]